MREVRTRGGKKKHEPYQLNEFPIQIIYAIAQRIVHLKAVGHTDMGDAEEI